MLYFHFPPHHFIHSFTHSFSYNQSVLVLMFTILWYAKPHIMCVPTYIIIFLSLLRNNLNSTHRTCHIDQIINEMELIEIKRWRKLPYSVHYIVINHGLSNHGLVFIKNNCTVLRAPATCCYLRGGCNRKTELLGSYLLLDKGWSWSLWGWYMKKMDSWG